jgi:hypothetical protein
MKRITETALANMIVREAGRYVGLREVKPNAKWSKSKTITKQDAELCLELRELMRPAPWQEGWAYCAAFAEGMVVSALRRLGATEQQIRRFSGIMNAHVMTSFNGFNKIGKISRVPEMGAIWFAQHGTSNRGHAGIVQTNDGIKMSTIEGNTSLDPSSPEKEREGDWITTRLRKIQSNGQLRTRGFLNPKQILEIIHADSPKGA